MGGLLFCVGFYALSVRCLGYVFDGAKRREVKLGLYAPLIHRRRCRGRCGIQYRIQCKRQDFSWIQIVRFPSLQRLCGSKGGFSVGEKYIRYSSITI